MMIIHKFSFWDIGAYNFGILVSAFYLEKESIISTLQWSVIWIFRNICLSLLITVIGDGARLKDWLFASNAKGINIGIILFFLFSIQPAARFISWGIFFFLFLDDVLGCLRVFFTLSFATQGPFFPGGPIRVLFFLFLLLLLWSFSPFSLLDDICFLKSEKISILSYMKCRIMKRNLFECWLLITQ